MPVFVDGVDANVGYGPASPAAPAIGTGGTIPTTGFGLSRVNPGGAVTGIILAPGTRPLQQVWVVNESANTVTFAASGSNVADGSTSAIAATTARLFVWDPGTNLWYRAA
jgi:hypothetical protein